MEEKTFTSMDEYGKWLQKLPDPTSGTPPDENGHQDIEDGDGNQYRVTLRYGPWGELTN